MDAMDRPVKDRAHTQSALERAPCLLDALQLLVPQRHIDRAQAIVIAMHHEFAVELRFRAPFGRVHPQRPAFGQAQITPIATARPQLTHPLAMALTTDRVERGPLGLEFPEDLLAMGAL